MRLKHAVLCAAMYRVCLRQMGALIHRPIMLIMLRERLYDRLMRRLGRLQASYHDWFSQ